MQELVQRAAKGDREAFAVLATGSIDHLFALARRILQDHDLAQDAVQTALLDAWRDLPSLRDPDRFEAWLYRLLVRACYDEARKQRAFRAHVRLLRMPLQSGDPTSELADRDQIQHAFTRLTVEQRAVVVLHFYAGLSLKQISQAIGVPEGTARSRLHYALRVMRAAIEADSRPVLAEGRIA